MISKLRSKRTVRRTIVAVAVFVSPLVLGSPTARADELGYLVNVHVRPGYNFSNADAALGYGYSLCESLGQGEDYSRLALRIKNDFHSNDELQVSYLLSQATQELCPAQIWQLRRSAAGYRP